MDHGASGFALDLIGLLLPQVSCVPPLARGAPWQVVVPKTSRPPYTRNCFLPLRVSTDSGPVPSLLVVAVAEDLPTDLSTAKVERKPAAADR